MLSCETADQAAGLRRLFGNRAVRSVAFTHVRRHKQSGLQIARAAHALAQQGQRVVIVDEHQGADTITALTGRGARDLFQSFLGECALKHCLIEVAPRIVVVPAARAAREFAHGEADIQQRMVACLAELGVNADFVLIDGAPRPWGISELARAADHLALAIGPQRHALTDAYGLIKRIGQRCGREVFHVVLEGVPDAATAQTAFRNLRVTAREHLGVELQHLASLEKGTATDLADGLLTRLPSLAKSPKAASTLRLRGMFGAAGLFESVV